MKAPPEVKAAALQRAAQKQSPADIANDLGISRATVYQWMREARIPPRVPAHPRPVRLAALRRLASGETAQAVAQDLGVRRETLSMWRWREQRRRQAEIQPRLTPEQVIAALDRAHAAGGESR